MIRNEFTVTKELYLEWCRETHKKNKSGKFQIFWLIMSAVNFAIGVYVLIFGRDYKSNGLYFTALGVFCIYRALRYKPMYIAQYKKFAEIMGGENWTRTIDFTDSGIITTNGNVTVRNTYDEITALREDGNKIYLDTDKNSVLRLFKDRFSQGSYEEFIDLIREKTKIKI